MIQQVQMLVHQLYPDFNDREIDRILPFFCSDADWPNGMSGGREVGHAAIRAYWIHQWQVIDSRVTPRTYRVIGKRIVLEVHQIVRDLQGQTLSDGLVFHVYQFTGDKVARMDIFEELPEFAAECSATSVSSSTGTGVP